MAEELQALTPTNAQRVSRVVRAAERSGPAWRNPDSPSAPGTPAFWAEITGESAGRYSWKTMMPENGELTDATPQVIDTNFSAAEYNGTTGIAVGTRVKLEFVGYDAGSTARYLFSVGGAGESVGQYMEMYHKMITNNQSGWGPLRLAPVP